MNEGILSESTKKSMLYLKSEVFYVYFFHFLLDIISRSRYHFISYYIISTHIPWDFFQLFCKLRDNKTDVDLKWIQWFFSLLFFFLYSLQTGSGKTYKGSRVNLHVLQEDSSSKKNTQYWKEKKNIKKFKGMQEFF